MPYRGRFAPSPSGHLHFGSLVAATASYLSARQAGGDWLLRIEDLDPPRTVPGSAEQIVTTLEALGFEWNGSILYQSTRVEAYQAALTRLLDLGLVYPCSCSRSELLSAQGASKPGGTLRYPGFCRHGPRQRFPVEPMAIRLRVEPIPIPVEDQIQGIRIFDVAGKVGDFVIRRRDRLYAYQLAVTVDDAAQGITHVVRGIDLWDSTPRQMILQ
ncbi:tRNA glutamyl-Q(34) synthetase GluQRS [Steroidobacter denitrificans]|uniref:tRNA glutamyl-Q(34) synthetase GluQRS n=1 Tax=Steroidobacter denitrificans TaxID=465721 RepID=UPI000A4E392E|nr:tRNA glutamyl-Q(34) synthetase GluQRS [Steroidobacter denitrificans]